MNPFRLLIVLLCFAYTGQAQVNKIWSLQDCVQYALENNLDIRKSSLEYNKAGLNAKRAQLAAYPIVSASTNVGTQFGRSVDPTTNLFTNTQLVQQGYTLNISVPVYTFGQIKSTFRSAVYAKQAAASDVEIAGNEILLNVVSRYLEILVNKEQLNLAALQIDQSIKQLEITKVKVEAGALSDLSIVETEAQLSRDSSGYITAKNNLQQSVLQLKSLLNLNAGDFFDISTPPVEHIPVASLVDLDPVTIYEAAKNINPNLTASKTRIKAASEAFKAARATLYPTIAFFSSLGTNFASGGKVANGISFGGYSQVTGLEPIITVGNDKYYVQEPIFKVSQRNRRFGEFWQGYGPQLGNNFRHSYGISVNVKIFNGGEARIGMERARLDLQFAEYASEQTDKALRQQIYETYNGATAALQRYNSCKRATAASKKAYDYSLKRFEVGLLNTLELITSQNNFLKASIEELSARFEYIFKIKTLEFLKGNRLDFEH